MAMVAAPSYAAGAFLEGDAVLCSVRGLTGRSSFAIFVEAFGPHSVCARSLDVGEAVDPRWLEDVTQAGASPWLRVDWVPGRAEGEASELGQALASVTGGVWVDIFPVEDLASAAARQGVALRYAAAIRQLAPRTRIVRTVDSRIPEAAVAVWRSDGAGPPDAVGIQVELGCPFCDGPRDVGAELAALEPIASGLDVPVVFSMVYVAHECHVCGARFPEYASSKLQAVLRWAAQASVAVVVVDSREASADPSRELSRTSGGLCSSPTLAAAYARLTGVQALERVGAEARAPSLVPADHSSWWLAGAAGFCLVLCAIAFAVGGRGFAGSLEASGARRRGRSALALMLVLVGIVVIVYPYVTELLAHPARTDERLPERWLRLSPPGRLVEKCAGPFTLALPEIGVVEPVQEDATPGNLRAGPCHYIGTARPGEPSNCCIAGHRSTYTAPFRRLLELKPGAEIIIAGRNGFRRAYRVAWVREVDAEDGRYLAPTPNEALTLSTCHPYGLASQRLMLRAYPGEVGLAAAHVRPVDEAWFMSACALLTGGVAGSAQTLEPTPRAVDSGRGTLPLSVRSPDWTSGVELPCDCLPYTLPALCLPDEGGDRG